MADATATTNRRRTLTKKDAMPKTASAGGKKGAKTGKGSAAATGLNHAAILTVNPGDLAADSMSVTNRVTANSCCAALGEAGTVWTGEADGTIAIRLPPYGNELERIPADKPPGGRASRVTVLHRVGDKMYAAYSSGAIKVFATTPTADGAIELLNENHQLTSAIYAICDINNHVYTAGGDWKIYMWDAGDYHYERLLYGHKNSVRALAAYVDPEVGEERVLSASDDGMIKLWNPFAPSQKDTDTACVATINTPGNVGVWSLAVMQDTMELWAGCEDGLIRVYDLYSKSCAAEVQGHAVPVVALRQIDDNVWSGAKDGTLIIVSRFTKDVVNVVKQPASSTSGGATRYNVCIQPVQRTIVNNVWVTNTEGTWQCWSQLSPESVSQGSAAADYRGLHFGDAESPLVPRPEPGGPIKVSNARGVPVMTAPAPDKDADIADRVAYLRRTVRALESEPVRPPPKEEPPVAGDDEDEAARLDLIEESIRRDHEEAEGDADEY